MSYPGPLAKFVNKQEIKVFDDCIVFDVIL